MDYKFDCDKFCKTFNVKQDKSIDSLRLTHNQDIHFHLRQAVKHKHPLLKNLMMWLVDFLEKL